MPAAFLHCLTLGLLLLLSVAAHPLTAQRRDFTGQYQPLRRIQADTRREGDSLRIYLFFPDGSVLQRGQPLRLAGWENYQAKRPLWRDTVRHLARRIRLVKAAAWVDFCVPASALQPGQVLSATCAPEDDADAGETAWLSLTKERLARPFLLTDSLGDPLLRRYVRLAEPFLIDCYGPDKPLTVKRYDSGFTAALPPMSTAGAPPSHASCQPEIPFSFAAGSWW
ncbi:hypothetical protein [Hymenobacter cellulosilyticus]|uniref:Uncharacterized protein n=1 Tax=Hymenobacter cellulosilyticus TaxID=2932248 RepID=A0A8T9Q499_9BACT|nr:hypothetical protein [Hymenobacter cellulosilyticus]UOQ72317.1 hypothetical protein MUN79_27870 [Hymenobacter cellulosilyticus]